MKKLLFISIAILGLSSCAKETVANFSYTDHPTEGKIMFSNKSKKANKYLWDFGDNSGNTSDELSPHYVYSSNGTYAVTLTVNNDKSITKDITVNNITAGECVFWTDVNTYGTISIFITSQNVGTITQTSSAAPICGSNGSVTVNRPAGIYNFTAENFSGSKTWNGTFTVEKDVCSKKKIN